MNKFAAFETAVRERNAAGDSVKLFITLIHYAVLSRFHTGYSSRIVQNTPSSDYINFPPSSWDTCETYSSTGITVSVGSARKTAHDQENLTSLRDDQNGKFTRLACHVTTCLPFLVESSHPL
ncbi:hypothetical protein FBUS_01173 [Fasciolopsis buskii]|uniref:Uncharacterized protein n=1 Tax=Fasciolopsis buskii TaxID=27845 RepID=A0A8E0RJ38_9TREM|nr:hypothetical protein FBUS_01173 [Fasciolopsis buski]